MENEIHKVVFFPHPCDEHTAHMRGKNIKEWNGGGHRRKFLKVKGDYVKVLNICSDSIRYESHSAEDVSFWGEWESESAFFKNTQKTEGDQKAAGLPQYTHEPKCYRNDIFNKLEQHRVIDGDECSDFYSKTEDGMGEKQNTDPYVFGNQFMYSCCKQQGRNSLKKLSRGDIIVFFGQKGKKAAGNYRCYIDTVFVVGGVMARGKYKDLIPELMKSNKVSTQFVYKTILPIVYGNQANLGKSAEDNVLYYGATIDEPVDGMFSFFPCKISGNDQGFKRFEHKPFIAHKVEDEEERECYPTNNVSVNTYKTVDEVKGFWAELIREIVDEGYMLGTKAEEPTPEIRKA